MPYEFIYLYLYLKMYYYCMLYMSKLIKYEQSIL